MNVPVKRLYKESIPVKIPCKPHVMAFLQTRYSVPYKLSLSDWLGIALFHILRRERYDRQYVANEKEYSGTLTILMAPEYVTDKGLTNVTDYTIYKINHLVESIITDMFLTYMVSRPEGTTDKEAIYAWIALYDFPDGPFTNYDNLKQKYFRFRNGKKIT